ncbi:hypothetical protein XaC1_545 [Xanthomonas phage XaC1]|nr:hypothetical protein XaC1_545 [Xanthomonas phage XaC1]
MVEAYYAGALVSIITFLMFYFMVFTDDKHRFCGSLFGALLYGGLVFWSRYDTITDNEEACASSTEQKILVDNVCYIKAPEGTYIKYDSEIFKK